MADLWNDDNPITHYGIHVPAWIEQDLTPSSVAAINQGGCASGAYMPAVTYHQAIATMAVFYLSVAVELWASAVEGELETAIDEAA